MPPKPKFTREEIVGTALDLVREKGIEALTARELGAKLGSSARPIFTVFRNMEELTNEVHKAAKREYDEYVSTAFEYTPSFKEFGIRMISFATEEPRLFRFLFMREHDGKPNFDAVLGELGDIAEKCVNLIENDYGLPEREARELFRQAWIYAYGVSMLSATRMCIFTKDELVQMLGKAFISMLMYIKTGQLDTQTPIPRKKDKK